MCVANRVLMSDIVVVAQLTRKKMKYLKHAALENVTASIAMEPATDTMPARKQFVLCCDDASFALAASNSAECDQWVNEVQKAKAKRA